MKQKWRRSGKKERQGESQDGFLSFTPLNAKCIFLQVFFSSHPVYDRTKELVLSFLDFTDISNMPFFFPKNKKCH
jgi:hypothetical protein